MTSPLKIISGAQTGADRAALDAALELKIPHGGWVPLGKRAEDGPIPSHYNVVEMPSSRYPARTAANVRDSDGTVIFTFGALGDESGCALTLRCCKDYKRPSLCIDLSLMKDPLVIVDLRRFVFENNIQTLNVAGSRESKAPGIYERVKSILIAAFKPHEIQKR